jgi:hypothetical protein
VPSAPAEFQSSRPGPLPAAVYHGRYTAAWSTATVPGLAHFGMQIWKLPVTNTVLACYSVSLSARHRADRAARDAMLAASFCSCILFDQASGFIKDWIRMGTATVRRGLPMGFLNEDHIFGGPFCKVILQIHKPQLGCLSSVIWMHHRST